MGLVRQVGLVGLVGLVIARKSDQIDLRKKSYWSYQSYRPLSHSRLVRQVYKAINLTEPPNLFR